MLSRLFPWAFFFNWMPRPKIFSILGTRVVLGYGILFYDPYKQAVIKYYKNQLCELDTVFKLQRANIELARLRKIADKEGIHVGGSEYPILRDALKALGYL